MRRIGLVVAAVLLASCHRPPPTSAPAAPLTERQHDSVIGASTLPGAAAVRGALRVSDSARARNARYDSTTRDH